MWRKELGLYNEILSRENGFETIISEFINPSIGQEHKVLLIRSMVKDADLILLDAPTSNLDFESRSAFFTNTKGYL
jgi:ABC-type transport system involved in cytochrome bd biosynthesis fused ATPase/permease subunit